MEIWMAVKDFEGFYEVSNLGRVRSIDRKTIYKDGRTFLYRSVMLKMFKDARGYLQVGFNKSGVKSIHRIHRLVAENFITCDDKDKEVNHIDGNKNNNKTSNLEWVTSSENTLKGYELGLFEKGRRTASERLMGNELQSKAVIVTDKVSGKSNQFISARAASRSHGRSQNYFTQLLRIGGENKFFKVEFE